MKKRFVVLDRDGTIIVKHHYLSDPDQVELIPNAAKALQLLQELGLGVIVVTNQSAIGRGLFDLQRLGLIHNRLRELLAAKQVVLNGIYFCPHIPEDNCPCRKPKSGLVEKATQKHQFTPSEAIVIGDNECDIELGKTIGATTFLVRTGDGLRIEAEKKVTPDYIVDDLHQAASDIHQTLTKGK